MPNGKQAIEPNLPELINGINDPIPLAKIIELRNKRLSYSEMATLLGCTKENICQRLKPFRMSVENLKSIKENRADTLAVVSDTVLNSLTETDIKSASAYQRVGMYGILYDKERIERGQVSSIVGHVDFTGKLKDLEAQEQALMAELGMTPEDD